MAGGFGGQFVHPDQILKSMTSLQLAEWMAYSSIEPFGERNRDLSVGILSSLFANANRNTKNHPDPFTAYDFMPSTVEKNFVKSIVKKAKKFSLLDMFRMLRDNQRKNKKKQG